MMVVRLSASRTGRLYPQECSWYSFSLGSESTPGPWHGRKEYVTEKSSDTTGNKQYYIGAVNMSIKVVKVTLYSEITQTATVCEASYFKY